MIPRSEPTWQIPWQQELQQLITSAEELLELLELDSTYLPEALAAAELFPLRVTRPFVRRMGKGAPHDPLLRQVLPLGCELRSPPDFEQDPLHEVKFNPVPGVVHKYKSRVLLIAASQCAINCRYCFRRDFPYSENRVNKNRWSGALAYLRAHPEVNEVILSGGDPLVVSDRELETLLEALSDIDHIKRLRIHSRLPIVLPSRITAALCAALTSTRLKVIAVVHCNHAREIDDEVAEALGKLRQAGMILLNQTVLLRGVNDSVASLSELSERLFAADTLPYYLHLLDKVKGASHFQVCESEARSIYRGLLAELPGFLVPKLVREVPDEPSKTPIMP